MYILVLNAGLFARFLLWGLKEWKARFLRQLLGLPILVTLAYVWYIGLIFFGEIDRFLVLKMENEVVEIAVGGVLYSLAKSDIQRYPGSFLDCIIKKEWSKGNDGKISIDRDGQLFKYLYAFLVCGSVPRDQDGALTLDAETLAALKVEADFYGLEKLARECETPLKTTSAANVTSYMTMRRYIEYAKGRLDTFEVEHPTALFTTELLHTLSEVWAPFCLTGRLIVNDSFRKPSRLFMSSTIAELNISELLNHATLSSFGHGTNTVTDTSVRNSFEINASQLEHEALEFIQKFVYLDNFMLNVKLETRPYKLVIYKEGGHFDAHRDTVRGEGHIGTLVLILNSTYTGGELEVTHGGRTEVVTGPYSWVAMYGDCLHKINPVTSGTRVSLIYDIYNSKDAASVTRKTKKVSVLDKNFKPFSVKNKEKKQMFWKCLEQDLNSYDSIIIGLEHLYPEGQIHPSFLKGGDRALYQLLDKNDSYVVGFVAVTIAISFYGRKFDCEWSSLFVCSLFSPTIVQRALDFLPKEPPFPEKTKLALTTDLSDDALLDHSPYVEGVFDDDQLGESVYIVTGLQVRKKKA